MVARCVCVFQVNEEGKRIDSVNLTDIASMEIFQVTLCCCCPTFVYRKVHQCHTFGRRRIRAQIRPFLTGSLNQFYAQSLVPSETSSRPRAGARRGRFSSARPSLAPTSEAPGAGAAEEGDGGSVAPTSTRKLRRFK